MILTIGVWISFPVNFHCCVVYSLLSYLFVRFLSSWSDVAFTSWDRASAGISSNIFYFWYYFSIWRCRIPWIYTVATFGYSLLSYSWCCHPSYSFWGISWVYIWSDSNCVHFEALVKIESHDLWRPWVRPHFDSPESLIFILNPFPL